MHNFLHPKFSDVEKLLEMGRVLYPEWNEHEGRDVWSLDKHHIADTYFVCINMDSGCHRIHWYEFLIRWIAVKLYGESFNVTLKDNSNTIIEHAYHDFKLRYPKK